jgi:Ser/Thr protein kinase RdoA (MazF antagonist)
MQSLDAVVKQGEAREIADAILELWRSWSGNLHLPPRHAHGDLKISNLRFDDAGRGVCLLDLDTLSRLPLDVELGDAWRSWCNPVGEDRVETSVRLETLAAAIAGYREVRSVNRIEREALVGALERIALELAARFCKDAVEDRYFGWSPERFPSRIAHNLFRARGQLNLARSARAQQGEIAHLLA